MFDFDEIIDRRASHSMKWDMMEPLFGVPAADGLPMWVADMDFRPPPAVMAALQAEIDRGVPGYFGDDRAYRAAITGWMARRHGWEVDPASILTTHGLVAAVGFALQAFSAPGDGVILFTPVYHAFHRIVAANGRRIVESPLVERDGRYVMDLDALAAALTGDERVALFCSPHNPGGRVWSVEEQRALAEFCATHGLILVADEIHHDLALPGRRHVPTAVAAPFAADRLVALTATTKTFNIAGALTGNAIVPDAGLRARLAAVIAAAGGSPNRFGVLMATAAYAEGDAWVDALCAYLGENARVFDAGIAAIPGLRSMPLEATYLAWVDFAGLGTPREDYCARVAQGARIAASPGPAFGAGGESRLRFNLGTPRARVVEAVARLQAAFADADAAPARRDAAAGSV
jgi:cystathionine beta-lyase